MLLKEWKLKDIRQHNDAKSSRQTFLFAAKCSVQAAAAKGAFEMYLTHFFANKNAKWAGIPLP